jgi:cytochrome c
MNMESPLWFYGKFLSLLLVVSAMVLFNFLTWGFHRPLRQPSFQLADANPERGPQLLASYGCGACHTLPGRTSMPKAVGPSLAEFHNQLYVAGTLPNTPANVSRWIQDPLQFRPHTAMPNLNVGEEDARDIAAYLHAPESVNSP